MRDYIVYLNMRGPYGVETVDEVSLQDFNSWNPTSKNPFKSFRAYIFYLIKNYRECGMDVYRSQRCTKDWRDR